MSDKLDSTLDAPSHSRLRVVHECRRKYQYKYVMKLASKGVATRPLAGKAGHAGLDVLHRLGYGSLALAKQAAAAAYGDHVPTNPEWMTSQHIQDILDGYVERWPEEDVDFQPLAVSLADIANNSRIKHLDVSASRLDAHGNVQLNENAMVIEIADGFDMTVVMDMLVKRADGSVWVVDHKWTGGYLGGGVLNKHLVNHQIPLYIMAAKALVGQCDGGVLNAVFMGQAANNPTSKAVKFDRYEFNYTDGQLAESLEWAKLTRNIAKTETAAFNTLSEYWPQNPAANCAGCDYLQLCEVAPALRVGRIASWYDHSDEEDVENE